MSTTFETIRYEKQNGIGKLTLNRPGAYNAFTKTMNDEMRDVFKQVAKDQAVRCLVITGEGKAFCSGEDLAGVHPDINHATFLRERYHPMMVALRRVPQPVVAAVNGVAAGAGMSLALACDFRLVHAKTTFVSAFTNIGLVPDSGMMYVLPRLIGYAKALEITVLGKSINGEKAVELGLATEMLDKEQWEAGVNAFAEQLLNIPTTSIALIKRYMMDAMHSTFDDFLKKEAEAQRIAGKTADHQEGVAAFTEKRTPHFTGK